MNSNFGNCMTAWQVTLLFASLASSVMATAHDPLRDDADHNHHEPIHASHGDHIESHSTDVASVRSLVVSFRETGDDRYLDEAWLLLEPALGAPTTDSETLVAAAFVAQSRHRFDLALALIDKALSQNSNNDEAWLLRASIQMVRGETEAAAAACGRLRTAPPLILLTCKARVALLGAEQGTVQKRLAMILETDESRHLPPDMLAWSHSVAGDLAVAAGQEAEAINHYQRSLDFAERTQVRAAMVDVFLNSTDYNVEDALRALDAGSDALPLLIRRLIAAKRLHRLHDWQPTLAKVQTEFDRWIENEDWLHAREMARFYLDVVEKPDLARQLALINIDLQREPEDIRLEQRTRRAGADTRRNSAAVVDANTRL